MIVRIMAMWMVLFLLTGFLAMVGSLIMPSNVERGSDLAKKRDKATAAMEGITGEGDEVHFSEA